MQDGKRQHHNLDPSTGQPADSGLIAVTIVSESGLLSDGLSTACFVLGKEKGEKLLETYGAEGVFIDQNKKVTVTKGLKDKFTILNKEYKQQRKSKQMGLSPGYLERNFMIPAYHEVLSL